MHKARATLASVCRGWYRSLSGEVTRVQTCCVPCMLYALIDECSLPTQALTPLPGSQVAGLQRSLAYGARVEIGSLTSLPACLASIYGIEGLRGLYKGAVPSLIKAAPAAAITFTVYEAVLGCLVAMRVAPTAPEMSA